jgi:putative glutamine amidotransferase
VIVPVIGVSSYREAAAWGVWSQPADLLHVQYADSLVRAGAAPVILPPATASPDVAAAVVDRLDGLVIAGGADVDPGRYGQQPHPRTAGWRPDRDAWEVALLTAAASVGLPVLGVCRGMQLMAVAAGGRLDQHTPDLVGHENHGPAGPEFGDTPVDCLPGSRIATIAAGTTVRCHHHQSVAEHPGYTATAWAADGTVEAFEDSTGAFRLGVQWHPEMGTAPAIFDALAEAAREFARLPG